MPHLGALDGARGVAVLLVLLDHASDAGMRFFPGADLNRAGKSGVYLFFVLSAFLLTHQFSQWRPDQFGQPRMWLNYALRRVLRIFPAYTVALLAYALMHKLKAADLAPHLLLREGSGHFWTIPVECKYYLALPLIALSLFWAGRRHWLLGAGAGALSVLLGWGLLEADQRWSVREAVCLWPSLPALLLGSALAILYEALQRHPPRRAIRGWLLEAAAFAALLALALRVPAIQKTFFAGRPLLGKEFDPALCGALWMLVLLGILEGRGWLRAAMNWAPLRYLGVMSFSAYLWHKKFLNDVDDFPAPSPVRLGVYLALVLGVSSLSYFLLERPLRGVRWPLGKTKPPAPPTPREPLPA